MPNLVVSDANVLIDMEHGVLMHAFFALPFDIVIPDVLYAEEIEPHMPDILRMGLLVRSLTPESIQYVDELGNRAVTLPSSNDQLALGLARQEDCTLLTGDQQLRRLAEAEGVDVHGTIWAVEQMVDDNLITVDVAATAFRGMLDNLSRLPIREINQTLRARGWNGPDF